MSKLAVKTRGGSNPQGKPRVYFSCHPGDFDLYFEEITDCILNLQNCAIYYNTERGQSPEQNEIESTLSGMQLFIVPITSAFLKTECQAKSHEYGFAIDHHIPILPLMMEPELVKLFAECMNQIGEHYGEIQFIEWYNDDPTTIPASEKIRKYLATVLTDDDTAARVRAAFDAYIFLSYRKKDRAEAQSLMKLIHSIPFCRDIAIWYDEYLMPGEGWSKAIAKAMEKSRLITMAVTPSFTEPGNYVLEQEYPNSVKSGKPIIAAEISPTDRGMLEKLFPGIPPLVDGKNAEAIEEKLKEIATTGNNNDPAHQFLIGLAYLGGIDVERDTGRALELITSAAKNGLPEAMIKLAYIYRNGDGTFADSIKGYRWQAKYVHYYYSKYKKQPTKEKARDLLPLFLEYYDYVYYLDPFSLRVYEKTRSDELCNIVSFSISLCKEWIKKSGHRKRGSKDRIFFRRYISLFYIRTGDNALEKTDYKNAEKWYKTALNYSISDKLYFLIVNSLKADPEKVSFHETALCLFKLGQLKQRIGTKRADKNWAKDLSKALHYYENAITAFDWLCDADKSAADSIEAQRNLSHCFSSMGEVFLSLGSVDKAIGFFEKALDIDRILAEEGRITIDRNRYALDCRHLGYVHLIKDEYKSAATWYNKRADILKDQMNVNASLLNFANDMCFLGVLEWINGNSENTIKWFAMASEKYEKHLENTSEPRAYHVVLQRDLSLYYQRLGDLASENGLSQEALSWYKKSMILRADIAQEIHLENDTDMEKRSLAIEHGTPESHMDLWSIYCRLSNESFTLGDKQSARIWHEKALSLNRKMKSKIKDNLSKCVEIEKQIQSICTREPYATEEREKEISFKYHSKMQLQRIAQDLKGATVTCKKSLAISKNLVWINQYESDIVAYYDLFNEMSCIQKYNKIWKENKE